MLCLTEKLSAGIQHPDVCKSLIDEMQPRVQATHHALLAVKQVVFTGIDISKAGLQLEERDRQRGIVIFQIQADAKRLRSGRLPTVISGKSLTRNIMAQGGEDGSNKRTKVSRISPVSGTIAQRYLFIALLLCMLLCLCTIIMHY